MEIFSTETAATDAKRSVPGGRLPLRRRRERGQALVEYLLMTLMLLALFTGLYKVLQVQLKNYFAKAGQAILLAYY